MDIVFMGTPDFAVPCLKALIDAGHNIKAVISQPDKPRGRGYALTPPPVKELALEHGLPVWQPVKLKDGVVAAKLREIAPDLAVVVAYGRLLPPDILAVPKLGCVNIHASLLPKLRGAAPIQWAVINGDKTTGVTSMYMGEGLDTGDMIITRETAIGENETAGELFGRLSELGAQTLAETVRLLENGTAPRVQQDSSMATHAPPISKEMAFLDFTKASDEICYLVRGLNPSPMAKTRFGGKLLRVLAARPVDGFAGAPGEILDTKRFIVGCGSGAAELLSVQPEGKKAMDGDTFIRGRRVELGERLDEY